MYKVFLTDQPGGFPIELDMFLAFQQDGYNAPIEALAKAFGDKVIISGLVESGSPIVNVSAGFAVVNNELVYFPASIKDDTFYISDSLASLIYEGNISKEVLKTRVATFGTADELQFNYADLRRISLPAAPGLLDRIIRLETLFSPLIPYQDPANPLNTVWGSWMFWGRPAAEIPTGWEAVPDADWKGKVPVVLDPDDADFDTVGATGGEKEHELNNAELPAHGHGITDPGHIHQVLFKKLKQSGSATDCLVDPAEFPTAPIQNNVPTDPASTGISINNTGSNMGHNNLQPYKVVMFIRLMAS